MHRRSIRPLAAGAVAVALLSACSDDGAADDTGTAAPAVTEPSPASPSPEATVAPSQASAEPVEVPEVDLTIESDADVERVVQEILAFRDWLFEHPDQRFRLDRIFMTDCDCYAETMETLESLDEDRERIVAHGPPEILRAEVSDSVTTAYGVQLRWRVAPVTLTTWDGEVLYEAEQPGDVQDEGWSLVRDDSGSFRLATVVRGG